MATFVQIDDEDPAVHLITLLSSLRFTADQKEEQSKFSTELTALVTAHKYAEVIEKGFFGSIDKVLDSTPEQINTSFNLSFALLNQLDAPTTKAFSERFATALTSRKDHATLKIKLLTILFNLLESRSPLRRVVLTHIINMAIITEHPSVLAFQLTKMEDWMNEWQLNGVERAELYLLASQIAEQTQQRDKHQQYMIKYLRALQEADEKTLAPAKEHAMRAVITAIQSSQLIDCDTLLSFKAVQQLKGDAKTSATFALLELVAKGDVTAFTAFCSEHKGHVEQLGLNYDVTLSKMRTLTIISLAKTRTRLTYEEVKQHLMLSSDDEVESRIVEAVMSGHVDAKLDQNERAVFIERVAPRTFDKETWQQLHQKLTAWKTNVHNVLSSLSAIRQQQV